MTRRFLLTVLISIFATTVYADGGKFSAYKTLDSDKDGYISQKEGGAMPILARIWDTVDVNEDGQLDTAEFARFESALERSTAATDKAAAEK